MAGVTLLKEITCVTDVAVKVNHTSSLATPGQVVVGLDPVAPDNVPGVV